MHVAVADRHGERESPRIAQTVLVLWAVVCPVWALDPSLAVSQYHKQTWEVEHGLPRNFVNDITQDARGELLIATEGGLARFDGLVFSPYSVDPKVTWHQQWFTSLHRQSKDVLWVGTRGGALYRVEKGEARRHALEPESGISDVFVDSGGAVWVVSSGGVWRGRGGALKRLAGIPGISGYGWSVAAQSADASVWLVTKDGLLRAEGERFSRIPIAPELGTPLAIYAGRSGTLWLGTTRGAFRVDATGRHRLQKVEGTFGHVSDILEDRDGNLWLATWGSGLFRVTGGRAVRWSTANGLADDFVRCIFEDSEGNLWIGMRSGGLSRWKNTAIIPFGPSEGLGGKFASAVAQAPGGRIYLGTWRSGLAYFENNRIHAIPPPVPATEFLVRSMAVDAKGTLWAGNWEGMFRGDGRGLRKIETGKLPPMPWSAMVFDRQGRLWLGTSSHGLLEYSAGLPDPKSSRLWLKGESITTLLNARDGAVLAGTFRGVARIAGTSEAVLPGARESAGVVTALYEDARGRVWAGRSDNSVDIISRTQVHTFGPAHGFPPVPVMAIAGDNVGNVWMSSPKGLYRIRMADVERLLAGSVARVDATRYGQEDGMRSSECHGKSQPAVAQLADGSLWFPTVGGFVQVRTDRFRDEPPPEPWLSSISVSGQVAPNGPVNVETGAGPVEIRYNAISLTSPHQLEFRYRLKGYEQDWRHVGSARSAAYTRLPGGVYSFELSARREGGEWSAPVSIAEVRQDAAFRETTWFAFLLAACGGAIVGGVLLVHLRIRTLRSRAVQLERDRIAREWHDTLLADFAAVSWQLEATRARIPTGSSDARSLLDLAHAMVRHSQTEARRLIHDLRQCEEDENASLCQSLQKALRRVNANDAIQTRVEVMGAEPPVALRHRRDILMICQEAVANALRHSKASVIGVVFDYTRPGLTVVVRDNGIGIQNRNPEPGHFGLRGMQERARSLGGQLDIRSTPGSGTTVTLSIPGGTL